MSLKRRLNVRELAPRVMRLLVFMIVVFTVGAWALIALVRSHVERSVLDTGGSLLDMTAERPEHDGPRTLVLNGHRLHFRTGVAAVEPNEFLRGTKRGCHESHDARDEVAVVDELEGHRGYVGCALIRNASEVIVRERPEARNEPGYRFVYAERGQESPTRFIEMWTDEPLSLVSLFPGGADSPGEDVPGVARPMRATRLLSAWEEGYGQRVAVYESEMRSSDLVDFYKSFFEHDGMRVVTTDKDGATAVIGVDSEKLFTVVVGDKGPSATVTVMAGL